MIGPEMRISILWEGGLNAEKEIWFLISHNAPQKWPVYGLF